MIRKALIRDKSIGISCMIFMAYVLFYLTGSNSGMHNFIQIGLFALWNVTAFAEDSKSYSYAISNRATRYLLLFLMYYFFTGSLAGNLTHLLSYIGVYSISLLDWLDYHIRIGHLVLFTVPRRSKDLGS